MRFDPAGYSWWGDLWNWIKDWAEGKKESASKNENRTETIGVTASAAFGFSCSGSLGITFDAKGNIGLCGTINVGAGFPSAGVGGFTTITDAPNIYKQAGLGCVLGASGGPGKYAVGGEYTLMVDTSSDETYNGLTSSATVGLYPTFVEVHGEVGYTFVTGFNVFDLIIGFSDFMLWFEQGA